MRSIVLLLFIVKFTIGLILRKHNGSPITAFDLAPRHQQHHIHKYFSSILNQPISYQIHNEQVSLKINANGLNDIQSPIINVVDYGADPFGILDSTLAFQKAIKDALSRGAPNTNLTQSIHDCGGATINLQGGDYLISETLLIPAGYGNMRITDGTIRANKNFSNATISFLLYIGEGNGKPNQFINIDHMLFDGKNIVFGCIHLRNAIMTDIGPQIFILGYNEAGIQTTKGHSLYLLDAWMGEYLGSDPRKNNYTASTATSIQLHSSDCAIFEVVIFSSRVGMNITGGGNIINSVHTWNLKNQYGGIGIILATKARLINCYLDGNDLLLLAPITANIENTFFLKDGTLVLKTRINNFTINALTVINSQYNGGNGSTVSIRLDETNGKFKNVNDVYVDNNLVSSISGYRYRSTNCRKTLRQIMMTEWKFDFSDCLLFDNIPIQWVQYTMELNEEQNMDFGIESIVKRTNGLIVSVVTNKACNATVYIVVDQARRAQVGRNLSP
eukprot:483350_1